MKRHIPLIDTLAIIATMIAFLLAVSILFCISGCATTLGIADRPEMMARWKGMHGVALLEDLNRWGNWYSGRPFEGKCVEQTETKMSILKELGIPCKRMHCEIWRYDPWHPIGHAFVLAQLNDKWYILDNGAVQDIPWEYEAVKKSTWGVTFE